MSDFLLDDDLTKPLFPTPELVERLRDRVVAAERLVADLERRLRSEVMPEPGDQIFGVGAQEFLAFRAGLRETNAEHLYRDLAILRHNAEALAKRFHDTADERNRATQDKRRCYDLWYAAGELRAILEKR